MTNNFLFDAGIITAWVGAVLLFIGIILVERQTSQLRKAIDFSKGGPLQSQNNKFFETFETHLRFRDYLFVVVLLGFVMVIGGLLLVQNALLPTQ